MKQTKSSRLQALTAAAMALPGISAQVQADAPPERNEIGYHYSQYQEDRAPESAVATGSKSRYDIGTHQFRWLGPVNEDYSLLATFDYEGMSGASPMGVTKGADGKPLLVMSGASIEDTRMDLNVKATRYFPEGNASASLGYSTEDDYNAVNLGVEGEKHFNNKSTTLSGGVGFSSDTIEPTQQSGTVRPTSEDKTSVTGFIGGAQVINAVSVIQTSLTVTMHDGYLSDPYRSNDVRPDSRLGFAWNTRYRRWMADSNAALHLDYRLYSDDWGILSHTLGMEWHQNLDDSLRITPSLRYYTQSQADFYVPFDVSGIAGEQSSDYRLSPYGAITLGLAAVASGPNWRLRVSGERYYSDGDFALGGVDVENPGLINFTLLTVGMEYLY
ncbi:MAG: DUF3570 domain-containing protein [Hahellaceae bacterium]|nr:DUF3570 domain-containing protein [Hahellaceae bacterium]MCP5169128.1 DUF3570 domain-containing protein [Hahellaceae bacterium]